jgi:apoptosis-inducing factor 2
MGSSASIANIHVVIVGSGYAGMAAAQALDGKCKVTVIEPEDALLHKIASMRGAVVPGWEKRIRIPLGKALKHGEIVRGEVQRVVTGSVTLADGTVILGDYIIMAHGIGKSFFPCGPADDTKDTASYEAKLRSKQVAVAAAKSVLIVGGGPTGIELAGQYLVFTYHLK